MVYAKFTPNSTNTTTSPVTQWDYGRKLRIEGLKLPTAVRIDFGVLGSQTTIGRIGLTNDGVTDVVIPDSFLEQSNNIVAYVYVSDTTEGKTIRTINIPVKERAKPEEYNTPESKELFVEAIEAVNDVAVRAENAESKAKSHADSAKESLEATEQIAESFNETAAKVTKDVDDAGTLQIQNIYNAKAETLEAVQSEGAAQIERVRIAGENIVNAAANAIKGHMKGEIVTADDVSSAIHAVKTKASGKNLFNVKNIELTGSTDAFISSVDENSITITTSDTYTKNGVVRTGKTLRDLAPLLEIGKTYVISAETQSYFKRFVLHEGDSELYFGQPFVPTEKDLSAVVYVYGLAYTKGDGIGDCIISNIQIEEGETATEYTPYIAPETVKVRRCGKNLYNGGDIAATKSATINIGMIPSGEYTISANVSSDDTEHSKSLVLLYYVDDSYKGISLERGTRKNCVVSLDAPVNKIAFYASINASASENDVFSFADIQIERGAVATEYEAYKGAEYTPAADGSVDGVTSIFPHMTILTDTEGVTMECEYNIDTKTYIDRKIKEMMEVE